jgi:hypothetical protein
VSAQDREPAERFRILPRPPRSRTGRSGRTFVTRVITEMSQVGRGLGRASRRGNHAMSRVIIKTQLVVLASTSPRAAQTHLRYIARDGVTPDGAPGVAYDARGENADLTAFEQRGRGDRHQFRFIIAPENAVELEDLHAFTRELMARNMAGIVERLEKGIWRVPSDIVERARAYHRGRLGNAVIELRSHLPIERHPRGRRHLA